MADTQLFYEFERIPKRRENARYDCALHDENRNKNYDSNYLPYDDNRVRVTPTRDNKMGYVNASHITVGRILNDYFRITELILIIIPNRVRLEQNNGSILLHRVRMIN